MLDLLFWLLAVSLMGLAVTPVLYAAFPNLADRGFGFARPLGMLIVGALVWMASLLHLMPNSAWSWWIFTVAIASCGWYWLWSRHRDELWRFVKLRWAHLVVSEAVFFIFFLLFAFYKLHDPDISGTEKPMDLMMLNAVIVADYAPPGDLWLSGHPVSYYYFGYWLFGGIAQMSSVAAEVAFNLSIALIAGMSATAIYSLTVNLIRRDGGGGILMMGSGAAAAVFLLVMSNLNGLWELLSLSGIGSDGFYEWLGIDGVDKSDPGAGWRPAGFWWWWSSSRVINTFDTGLESAQSLDFTIQEFPFFSLLLGDLHPHVMSIPFVLLSVGMVANIVYSSDRWGIGWLLRNRMSALLLILMVGASGFINAWDLALILVVLLVVVYLKSRGDGHGGGVRTFVVAVMPIALILAAAALFFSNYYFMTLRSQIQFPPLVPAQYGTRAVHFLTVWGGMLSLSLVFLCARAWHTLTREREYTGIGGAAVNGWAHPLKRIDFAPWAISGAIVIGGYLLWFASHYLSGRFVNEWDIYTRLVLTGPMGLIFIVLFVGAYRLGSRSADSGGYVALLSALYALLLLFGAELFFLHDFFANRMNTVFKFYYQAWIMLSLAGGYGVFHMFRALSTAGRYKRLAIRAVFMVAMLLVIFSLYYPIAASITKTGESSTRATLDGLAYLEERQPEVREALRWIRENVDKDDVIVEGVGGGYSEFGRYSGFTGSQSVLGWTGHENQWRGGGELWQPREADIQRIYTIPGDEEGLTELVRLLNHYQVEYVIVGPDERQKYTDLDDSKFDSIATRAYENSRVTIYRLRDDFDR